MISVRGRTAVVADQAINSLSNLALSVAVARQRGPEEFGRFALVMTVYSVIVSLSRLALGQTVLLRSESETDRAQAAGVAVNTAAMLAAVGILVGLAVDDTVLIMLSIGLPVLILQDVLRYCYQARNDNRRALLMDAIWLLLALPAMWVAASYGATATVFVAVWLGAAATGLVSGARRRDVRLSGSWGWISRGDNPARALAAEAGVLLAGGQVGLFTMGAIGGAVEVGTLRAGYLLSAPLTLLFTAMPAVLTPYARTDRGRSRSWLGPAGLLTVVCVGWLLVVVILPNDAGSALLGRNWRLARDIAVPVAISQAAIAVVLVSSVYLRVERGGASSLRPRAFGALAEAVAGAIAAVYGAAAVAWSVAAGNLVQVALLQRARRGRGDPPAPGTGAHNDAVAPGEAVSL